MPTFAAPQYAVLIPSLNAVDDLGAAVGNLACKPSAGACEKAT